jgi:hypothetical protein
MRELLLFRPAGMVHFFLGVAGIDSHRQPYPHLCFEKGRADPFSRGYSAVRWVFPGSVPARGGLGGWLWEGA